MSSASESRSGVEDFDSGQRGGAPGAGPSGSPVDGSDGDNSHSRPRVRTSLFNQDSILAEEAHSSSLLTENMGPTALRLPDTAPSESRRRSTADSAELSSSSVDASANGTDRGSALREGGGARLGGLADRREAPAGGRENTDNSGSGSGTFRSSSQALALQHSASGKKRAPWQIDLSEVDLGELIASGSFGSVHQGRYCGREVAIKLLHIPESSSDKERRAALHAFKQEVSVWHVLHHPNIVEFIGASMEAKQWAIVTEYIGGGSLKSFTAQRQGKKLPLQQAVNMALDVAHGMAYLHNKDILHRDLKSANLLIDPAYRVKVADFGLARQEAADPGDMTCETGTIRWMAPEVIDHRPYTRKVDVYSFSIVAWEIFTMKLPFEGFSFVQLAHAVVANNARPPLAGIPKPLADILERCWDPVPERRPDFNTVVKWLEDVLDSGVSDLKDAETAGCCACTIL